MPKLTIETKETKEQELEKILREFGDGYKMVIYRFEPSWCDGSVGTFDLSGDIMTVDDIRRRWGGRKVRITVKDSDGKHIASRTLNFPDPPRDDGVEIVPGPNGTPVRIDRLDAARKEQKENMPPAAAAHAPDATTALLEKLLDLQSQNSQATQTMLLSRVTHLESMLEQRRSDSFDSRNSYEDNKPFEGLRETMKMVKELEEMRAVLGAGRPEFAETESPWTSAVSKLMEFVLEKEKMQLQQRALLPTPAIPPLPALSPPPSNVTAPAPANLSDAQLVDLWQRRIANLPIEMKAQVIQAVLGADTEAVIAAIPEPEDNSENGSCDPSQSDIRSDLVSAEDRALLSDNDNQSTGTPPTADRS